MFWGLSESLDLLNEYLSSIKQQCEENSEKLNKNTEAIPDENDSEKESKHENINILIFGAGDPRHVIKTMAKLYTHRSKSMGDTDAENSFSELPTINFYMLDGCVEIIARNIALLSIALENSDSFNLLSKVHLFMDVYGNALLRPSSHQYLVGKSKSLLKMITDDSAMQQLTALLNIDGMKYRERDGLENAFNFLSPNKGHVFNIQEYWGTRLRRLLGTRYDHRDGAFDWDLNMILKDREAKQICSQEYKYWRETGIAFSFPEYEQCKPNKTLAVGLIRNGEKYGHRGYVGDIETGPFCAFGLRTWDERMLKSLHGENDYRSSDIVERNLLEFFHELKMRTPYVHDREILRKYGSVRLQMGKRLTWNECDVEAMQNYDKPWIQVDGVKVNFLSADDVFALQDANGRWRDFFHVAFIGHNYFAFIRDTFVEVLRENALLILETKLLTLARKDAVNEFECKLKNYAKNTKLESVINYNAINAKNTILKFKKAK